MQSNNPTKDAIKRPFTPKKAPELTELFVAARQPSNDDALTKAAATKVPTKIAETLCHQLKP
jgi:hypothetical protein